MVPGSSYGKRSPINDSWTQKCVNQDKRAATLQALKAKLEEQFNDSFTVSSLLIFKFSLFIIVTRFMLTLKILKSAALSCCMENNVFAPAL